MADDAHVDGNAIGGVLMEFFGREMTDARGRCAHCGALNAVGALVVYRAGPGDVVRCPGCMTVLLVATPLPDGLRVSFADLRWLQVGP
jgi:hypothetical protein